MSKKYIVNNRRSDPNTNRPLLINKRNRIEVIENNIAFYSSIKNTPVKLLNRAIDELKHEWSAITAIIELRHHYRNKRVNGKNRKRAMNLANLLNDIDKNPS